jgi:ribose 5-phosphate isomerase B
MKEIIYIASDHAGYDLKLSIIEHLKSKNINVKDLGPFNTESVDYPDYAKKLSKSVLEDKGSLGILICGTGIGMCITANRFRGIRAALASDIYTAQMAKEHNNSNVLCLGSRVLENSLAIEIVDVWLNTGFASGRHQKRIDKFDN